MDLAVGVLDRDPVAGVVDGVLREAAAVLSGVPDGSDGILRQTVREVEDEDVAGRATSSAFFASAAQVTLRLLTKSSGSTFVRAVSVGTPASSMEIWISSRVSSHTL